MASRLDGANEVSSGEAEIQRVEPTLDNQGIIRVVFVVSLWRTQNDVSWVDLEVGSALQKWPHSRWIIRSASLSNLYLFLTPSRLEDSQNCLVMRVVNQGPVAQDLAQ